MKHLYKFNEELNSDDIKYFLSMDPWKFDQSEEGWRSLEYDDQNYIIDCYLKEHPDNELSTIMFFHMGQTYAMQGDNENAILSMYKSLEKGENKWNDDWNSYVILTISFLKKDIQLFKNNYDKLYNKIISKRNKKIIDNMKNNFNLSYEDVYSM